jgi:cytochrome c553
MVITAEHATEEEVALAAAYFASLRPRQRTHVVEASEIPRVLPATGLFVRAPGNDTEPLNGRLIEVPADVARHDYRDPYLEYDAYVPVGSVARGRRLLATPMNEARQICGSCHGPALRGMGDIPPIAGRSPAYLVRQLLAFRNGTRNTPAGAPMRLVSQKLSLRDMISVAAYTATLQP